MIDDLGTRKNFIQHRRDKAMHQLYEEYFNRGQYIASERPHTESFTFTRLLKIANQARLLVS